MKTIKFIIITSLLFVLFTDHSYADDITAQSCSHGDVQSAIDQVADGETVFIPEGDCYWDDDVDVSGPVKIKGAGIGKTTIRSEYTQLFEHRSVGGDDITYAEYADMTFYGAPNSTASSNSAISLFDAHNFRIHNCLFEASNWHGVIDGRRVYKGWIFILTSITGRISITVLQIF